MGRACSAHGDEKFVQNFGRKPDEKKLLGKPRHRWEIKAVMHL
jgi:hypothetical protein